MYILPFCFLQYYCLKCELHYLWYEFAGEGIGLSGVAREQIFLTSKLWISYYDSNVALEQAAKSMQNLNTDYLDLFLLHWPADIQDHSNVAPTWRALELLLEQGTDYIFVLVIWELKEIDFSTINLFYLGFSISVYMIIDLRKISALCKYSLIMLSDNRSAKEDSSLPSFVLQVRWSRSVCPTSNRDIFNVWLTSVQLYRMSTSVSFIPIRTTNNYGSSVRKAGSSSPGIVHWVRECCSTMRTLWG